MATPPRQGQLGAHLWLIWGKGDDDTAANLCKLVTDKLHTTDKDWRCDAMAARGQFIAGWAREDSKGKPRKLTGQDAATLNNVINLTWAGLVDPAAVAEYESRTLMEADQAFQVDVYPPKGILTVLGTLEGITYDGTLQGERAHYTHSFRPDAQPMLVVDEANTLHIIGGNFSIEDVGIVDGSLGALSPDAQQVGGALGGLEADLGMPAGTLDAPEDTQSIVDVFSDWGAVPQQWKSRLTSLALQGARGRALVNLALRDQPFQIGNRKDNIGKATADALARSPAFVDLKADGKGGVITETGKLAAGLLVAHPYKTGFDPGHNTKLSRALVRRGGIRQTGTEAGHDVLGRELAGGWLPKSENPTTLSDAQRLMKSAQLVANARGLLSEVIWKPEGDFLKFSPPEGPRRTLMAAMDELDDVWHRIQATAEQIPDRDNPKGKRPPLGSTLDNGWIVEHAAMYDEQYAVVMAQRPRRGGFHDFAVWHYNTEPGASPQTFWGDYHTDYKDAYDDYRRILDKESARRRRNPTQRATDQLSSVLASPRVPQGLVVKGIENSAAPPMPMDWPGVPQGLVSKGIENSAAPPMPMDWPLQPEGALLGPRVTRARPRQPLMTNPWERKTQDEQQVLAWSAVVPPSSAAAIQEITEELSKAATEHTPPKKAHHTTVVHHDDDQELAERITQFTSDDDTRTNIQWAWPGDIGPYRNPGETSIIATDGHRMAIIPVRETMAAAIEREGGASELWGTQAPPDAAKVIPNEKDQDTGQFNARALAALAKAAKKLNQQIKTREEDEKKGPALIGFTKGTAGIYEGPDLVPDTEIKAKGGKKWPGADKPRPHINPEYLYQALKNADGSVEVGLGSKEPEIHPTTFTREDGEFHIIMPQRVS